MIQTVFISVEISSVSQAQVGWISQGTAEEQKQHSQLPIIADKVFLMHHSAPGDHPAFAGLFRRCMIP
jgi:hypothetical protein